MIPAGYHHRLHSTRARLRTKSPALTKAKALRKFLADLRVVTPIGNDVAQEIVCKMRIHTEELIQKLEEPK